MSAIGIIPARYASTRFPGKALADIAGKSMIQRVHEQACLARSLEQVYIATDDQRIYEHATGFGAAVIMTSENCRNGTERITEALLTLDNKPELVINIQGDEPVLQPEQLDQLIQLLQDSNASIATLATELEEEERSVEHIVKVALDDGGTALGFSRDHSFISQVSDAIYKHIGLYAFRSEILQKLCTLQPSPNELLERLEQLRWLDHGYEMAVGITAHHNLSVDVASDIDKILDYLRDCGTE